MKIIDAYILASTKRKTRRIRMAVVTFSSALLFGVLIFSALVLAGLQESARRYENVGYNNTFLTSWYSLGGDPSEYDNAMKAVAVGMDAELKARKITVSKTLKESEEYKNEQADRATNKLVEDRAKASKKFAEEARAKYRLKGAYAMETIGRLENGIMLRTKANPDPFVTDAKKTAERSAVPQKGQEDFMNTPQFLSIDNEMMKPFVRPGMTLTHQPGEPYPIFIPLRYALLLSGRSLDNASASEKIAGYRSLMTEYTGKVLSYCYRNDVAQTQVHDVLQYNKVAESDNDPKTVALAIPACVGFDQSVLKKLDIIQAADTTEQPLFPVATSRTPETREIKMKVIGFVPSVDFGSSMDIFAAMLSSVNAWQANLPVFIPKTVAKQDTWLSAGKNNHVQTFFEFATRQQQKQFIEEQSCRVDECTTGKKPLISAFGSIKVSLEEGINFAKTVAFWAVTVIGIIASSLIALVISKVMADSAKEIAVFRALGARRIDIAQVYMLYGMMLAVSALIIAFVLAIGVAAIMSLQFGDYLNQVFMQTLGAYDSNIQSTLLAFEPIWLLTITGALIFATILGTALPVMVNVTRNVMKLMREE